MSLTTSDRLFISNAVTTLQRASEAYAPEVDVYQQLRKVKEEILEPQMTQREFLESVGFTYAEHSNTMYRGSTVIANRPGGWIAKNIRHTTPVLRSPVATLNALEEALAR